MTSRILLVIALSFATLFFNSCKDDDVVPAATIISISPEEGHVGDIISVSGKHFTDGDGTAQVFFNGTTANITTFTDNQLQVVVPEGATSGKISFTVNGQTTSSERDFTVLIPPVVNSFSPLSGGVGAQVIINGANFSATTSENHVTFNGIAATVTASSATQLTVTVPQAATTGAITVTVKNKSFTTANSFTVVPTNEWQAVADFAGPGRYYAVGFAIGTKGYISMGRRPGGVKAKDLWEYNTETNTWTQKADVPAVGREEAIGFSIGTKGYVGTGTTGIKQKDIWEYDPTQNQWTAKDDFGGGDRSSAFVFVVGTKAYVGSGLHGELHERMRDLWEFDPSKQTGQQWTEKQSVGAADYTDIISGLPAAAFTLGGKGYVAIPLSNGTKPDFWEYTPSSNTWVAKQKTPVDILASSESVSFVLNEKGYLLSGAALWRYDAANNAWLQKAAFPLANIRYATGFANGAFGFAGLGYTTAESLKFYKYYPD